MHFSSATGSNYFIQLLKGFKIGTKPVATGNILDVSFLCYCNCF